MKCHQPGRLAPVSRARHDQFLTGVYGITINGAKNSPYATKGLVSQDLVEALLQPIDGPHSVQREVSTSRFHTACEEA